MKSSRQRTWGCPITKAILLQFWRAEANASPVSWSMRFSASSRDQSMEQNFLKIEGIAGATILAIGPSGIVDVHLRLINRISRQGILSLPDCKPIANHGRRWFTESCPEER